MAVLLAFLVFVLIVGIFVMIWLLRGGTPREQIVRRRLEAVQRAERRGSSSVGLDLARDELMSDVPVLNRMLLRWSWAARLRNLLAQAGMHTKPGKVVLVSAVLGVGIYFVLSFVTRFVPVRLAGGVIGLLLPFIVILFMRSRRFHEFEKHFPEALDLLARAIRSGHAFTTGLELIGKELPEPVSGEFRTAFEEQNFGLPLRDALLNLCERVPLIDVRFFVTALLIQKETGGNLAEILDNLARVIRERFRVHGEVRVRTAQGRLTAAILISLPPIMLLLMRMVNPNYIKPLFEDPMGPYMLGGAAVLQLLGSAILWKIVHIEV
jgi:tight adherence protein B